MTKGYIHSIETCGTVDGPGLRYVIFLQGCPMRCQYCHNPDTWEPNKGDQMTVDEVLESFYSNTAFYKTGGVTVTGGEPMMQMDFLIELFTELHEGGFHTCIDTSGIMFQPDSEKFMQKLEKLMEVTDLVMLDIKHIDPIKHKKLTAQENKGILAFTKYLEEKGHEIGSDEVLQVYVSLGPTLVKLPDFVKSETDYREAKIKLLEMGFLLENIEEIAVSKLGEEENKVFEMSPKGGEKVSPESVIKIFA